MKNGAYNSDRFHVERKKLGELEFTSNKVLLCHFEPPEFNIVLAIHVHDNAVAFGPCDFAANEILTPQLSPNRTYGAGRPHVGLCPIFLVDNYFTATKHCDYTACALLLSLRLIPRLHDKANMKQT